jgi:hypothetical protein
MEAESPESITDWSESPDHAQPDTAEQTAPATTGTPSPAAPVAPESKITPVEEPSHNDDRDEKGRFNRRHRARSQQAGPEDVPRIAELTRRLRETEEKLAAREAKEAEAAKKIAPIPEKPKLPEPNAVQFTDKEPTIDDFNEAQDPYAAWLRAVGAYDRKKEAFDRYQERLKQHTESATKQHGEQFQQWTQARQAEHDARLGAYLKTAPDAVAMMEKIKDMPVTPIMVAAIELSEHGPQFMHTCSKYPELVDELYMLTDGKPVGDPLNNPLVASVQRRLLARMQAVGTGSAAQPKIVPQAPRPPNPVRTAPQAPSDQLPGDDDSLEAHERAFVRRR